MTEAEAYEQMEEIFGKEVFGELAGKLTARYGDDLDNKILSAVKHLSKTYSEKALGELFSDGRFEDIETINDWACEGEQATLNFDSMADESGVPASQPDSDYEGLAFPSMDNNGGEECTP